MPRPNTSRNYNPVLDFQPDPSVAGDPLVLFDQPRGVNYVMTRQQAGPQFALQAQNFRITDAGKLRIRYPFTKVGTTAAATLIGAVGYVRNDGVEQMYRWTSTTVEVWNGTTWTAVTGPAFTALAGIRVSTVPWGNFLLFTVGANGIYKIDPSLGTYTLITGSPVCKYITTFGGRVVATGILSNPQRIQWSVKDNSDDWVGTGSGFEDLAASPGGGADIQYEFYPLNDSQGLALRSSSVWLTELTFDVTAPFNFRYLEAITCDTPRGAAMTPYGLCAMFRDNIYLISTSGIKPIGDAVKPSLYIVDANWNANLASFDAAYYKNLDEFYLYNASTGVAYVYKFKADAWTTMVFSETTTLVGFVRTSFKGASFLASSLIYFGGTDVLYEDLASTAAVPTAILLTGSISYPDPLYKIIGTGVYMDVTDGATAITGHKDITYVLQASSDLFVSDNITIFSGTYNRSDFNRVQLRHNMPLSRNQLQYKWTFQSSPGLTIEQFVVNHVRGGRIML